MKKTFRTLIMGACLTGLTLGTGYAQIGDIGVMLSGGVEDAEKMLTEYLSPLANSLGANLNGGWYNTAKVHGTLGFDLTFSVSTAFAPDDSKLYDLSTLGLTAIYDENMAPTFSGEKVLGPTMTYEQDVLGTPVEF